MDYETFLPLVFRGTERLLIVAAAALCIVLGYKLFKVVPSHRDSEGKFSFGDLSVALAKVGPGVFFSLFGAFVLYQSVQSTLNIDPRTPNEDASEQDGRLSQGHAINWMVSRDREVWAARAPGPVAILNCLSANATGTPVELQRIEDAIHTAKIAIIGDVWLPAWGDSSAFAEMSRGNVEKESPVGEIYYALKDDC